MKQKARFLLALACIMSLSLFSATAQVYVHIRPPKPVFVVTPQPSPRHVWIDEEWEPKTDHYEYNGGRWMEAPHEGDRYSPGYWRHNSKGHSWHPGKWNNGYNKPNRRK